MEDNVKAIAEFKKELIELIEVEYGTNDEGDYVWHFSTHYRTRTMPNDLTFYLRVIKTYLMKVIPEDIEVDVHLPPADWDIKVITVKAKGIVNKWSFHEEDMTKHLPTICKMMSDELNKIHKKR